MNKRILILLLLVALLFGLYWFNCKLEQRENYYDHRIIKKKRQNIIVDKKPDKSQESSCGENKLLTNEMTDTDENKSVKLENDNKSTASFSLLSKKSVDTEKFSLSDNASLASNASFQLSNM